MAKRAKASKVVRILNCIPSREVERDWTLSNADDAGALAAPAALPPSRDLREDAWWKIADQGQTGSCVGWAAADSVIRWHFVKAGKLAKEKLLSVRYLWMASKESDEFNSRPSTFLEAAGTSLKAALDIVRKFGIVDDSVLPFGKGTLYAGEPGTFYAVASSLKISSYYNLGRDTTAWKKWLSGNGPILTRLDVDSTWMGCGSNGVLDVYRPETASGGHAVALVGYTKDSFIVRNSWGTGWGSKGYAFATIPYANQAFTEAYGVIV